MPHLTEQSPDRRHGRSLIVLAAAALVWPGPAPAPLSFDDYDPHARQDLVLALTLGRHTLDDAMLAIADGGTIYYPLGAIARNLELPIEVDPLAGRAEGWILEGERQLELALDCAGGTAHLADKRFYPRGEQCRMEPEDLYIDAALLTALTPVHITYEPRTLTAALEPTGPLPLLQRLERERRWSGLRDQPHDYARRPVQPHPYRPWSVPAWAVAVDHRHESREGRPSRTDGELRMAGDFLYHEASLYAATTDGELDRADVTLARDVRRPWLTRYELGRVRAPSAALLTHNRSGLGVSATNAPRGRPGAGVDGYTVEGDAPEGWSAELYRNGELIDFIGEISGTRYRFADVPTAPGENRYDVKLYGPRGQVRTERHTVYSGPGMLAPGEIRYDISRFEPERSVAGDYRPFNQEIEGPRARARVEAGLHPRLSAGWEIHRSDGTADHPERAAGVDLTGSAGLTWWQLRRVRDLDSGRADRIQLFRPLGRWSAGIGHTVVDELASEDLGSELEKRTEAQASGPVRHWFHLRADYRRDDLEENRSQHRARLYQTGRVGGVRIGHRIVSRWSDEWERETVGSLDTGSYGGKDRFGLGLRYAAAPEAELETARASWNRRWNHRITTRTEVTAGLSERFKHTLRAGVSGAFRAVRVGAHGVLDEDGEWHIAVGVESGGMPNPHTGGWTLSGDGRRHLHDGATAVRVSLDDGVEERPQEGIVVRSGGRSAETGADGVAMLTGLDPYRRHDIELDLRRIDDPFIRRLGENVSVDPRPGMVQPLEYRLAVTGEIEGVVRRIDGDTAKPVAGVRVTARDEEGTIRGSAVAAFDGLYILDRLPPGRYTVDLHPDDARRLGVDTADTAMEIEIRGGDIVYSADISWKPPKTSGNSETRGRPMRDPQ